MSHIDSAGLGLLTLTHKHQTGHGITMVIAATLKPVEEILRIVHIGQFFPICDSVAAAGQIPIPLR